MQCILSYYVKNKHFRNVCVFLFSNQRGAGIEADKPIDDPKAGNSKESSPALPIEKTPKEMGNTGCYPTVAPQALVSTMLDAHLGVRVVSPLTLRCSTI